MPLLVSDYSWTQTRSTVWITVPLKGAKASNVDIRSTDQYLRVHYPPYLFEAFLFESVDDDRSTAKVGKGEAVFSLSKRADKMWEGLMKTTNEKERTETRERALLKQQEKLSTQSTSMAKKQHAERKYALETMMKLEQEKRDSIQETRDREREKTTAELASWQQRQKQEAEEDKRQTDQHKGKTLEEEQQHGGEVRLDHRGSRRKQVELPAPRVSANIQVTFTPRVFPTALRESRVPEEEEWLRKQAAAKRAASADVEDLTDLKEEERNPDWLKDRGDRYFLAGDFLGALSCYDLAIRLNRRIPALFSNRAACHLQLKNLHRAIADSSQALDLLTPPVAANAAARVRANIRRGTAFCRLQLYAEGLQDYQAALQVDPHNEALVADIQRIRDVIQGNTEMYCS